MTQQILRKRANIFPGPCHVCRVHVPRREGVAAQTREGWLLFCGEHEPREEQEQEREPEIAAPASYRPAVSEAAEATARALAARAELDGNHTAAALAWELVAAAVYARGGDPSDVTARITAALAERDRLAPREGEPAAPAGDDLVAEILARGEPAALAPAAREVPIAFVVREEEVIDVEAREPSRKRAKRKTPPRAVDLPRAQLNREPGEALKGWL